MGIDKDRISSPLEAGTSLLDSQKLPIQFNKALDYVSNRLIRRNIHLTLIVVRHDSPLSRHSPSISPPTPSRSASLSSLSRMRLPPLPGSPRSFISSTSSAQSLASSRSSSPSPSSITPQAPSPYGISLHHASTLNLKTSRLLDETIAKASKKYPLGDCWLSTPSSPTSPPQSSPSAATPSQDLIRRSLQQNNVLFSSEGLTLLSLDRVYIFKQALSAYTRSLSQPAVHESPEAKVSTRNLARLNAVDELRLLVLSQKGRRISQSYLLRAYDHLSFSTSALRSVNECYKSRFFANGVDIESGRQLVPNTQLLRSGSGRKVEVQKFSSTHGVHADMGPHYRAPATPGGYEEVTPVTRKEWHWLMGVRA